jgi:lipoprotein-releasing system permease protein
MKRQSAIPRSLRFEAKLAFRHLRSGGGQTILTISAVAVGVIIVVFITSLIFGLQKRLTELLTESIPHITIRTDEMKPVPLQDLPGVDKGTISSRVEQGAPQLKNIEDWAQVIDTVRQIPEVRAIAPAVNGQVFVSKGSNPIGVSLTGAQPELLDAVTPITKNLIAGHFLSLSSEEVVIGYELAEDLGVALGDRVRLSSSTGVSQPFTIAGIYSQAQGRRGGSANANAYVTLRAAQSLFGLGTSVNTIFVKLVDLYLADQVADNIMALFPYEAKSWSREFPSFISSLQAQRAVAYLISIFSLIASSFAIASILIVSVLQKSKQIGILKSMGARRKQILKIFLLEGLGIALIGGTAGAILGTLIVFLLGLFKQPVTQVGQEPAQLFPVSILPFYIALAILAAIASTVIAALLPARRAAGLNPVDVMK